ncbi:MAG: PAS domain S-box protein [Rhodocyclaceae bacterium]|nr:PAS domain S-box protein [Rhodocyclaceae bacterium]
MKNWGIEARVLFVALVPGVVVAFTLVAYFLAIRYGDAEQELASRGQALARQLAQAAEYGAFSGNVVELRRLALLASREPDVSAVAFADRDGTPWVIAGSPQLAIAPSPVAAAKPRTGADGMTLAFEARIEPAPVSFEDPPPGAAEAGPTGALGSVHVEMSRRQVEARRWEILGVTAALVLSLLVAAGFLARRLGRDVTAPLRELERVVSSIGLGQMDARVAPHRAGTLRVLEDGINAMAASLAAARQRSESALADSEAALRRQNEFADALLKAQSDAGIATIVVEDGRIVYSNPAMRLLSGYSERELAQMPSFIQLVHPEAHEDMLENYQRRLAGESLDNRYEIPYVNRQGDLRHAEVSIARIPTEGGNGMLVVAFDSTKRKRDAERLARAHAELQDQKDAAERASQAKSRFLAAASHDLRQPLHALSLFVSELESAHQSAAQRRLVSGIATAADSMHEMLAALLDISRIDLAGLNPQIQACPLQPLLERIAVSHAGAARDKGLRVSVARTTAWARTDPRLLERIVANLLANAVRYTDRGGVLMGVRREGAEHLRIEVWDTGIGIEPEHVALVFQEFYQVANPERDARKGLGLGLSIVERLSQALDHPVRVRSAPGRGTVFSVTVPRAPSPATAPAPAEAEAAAHPGILVVAPREEAMARLCGKMMEWGCQVTAVAEPSEATHLVPASDLVVCDGTLLAALAGAVPTDGRTVPLLVVGDPDAAAGWPAAAQIAKPVRPAKLRALLQHLLPQITANSAG